MHPGDILPRRGLFAVRARQRHTFWRYFARGAVLLLSEIILENVSSGGTLGCWGMRFEDTSPRAPLGCASEPKIILTVLRPRRSAASVPWEFRAMRRCGASGVERRLGAVGLQCFGRRGAAGVGGGDADRAEAEPFAAKRSETG